MLWDTISYTMIKYSPSWKPTNHPSERKALISATGNMMEYRAGTDLGKKKTNLLLNMQVTYLCLICLLKKWRVYICLTADAGSLLMTFCQEEI